MATLVLSAVGSIFGPIGTLVGSFIGQQIDSRIFSPKGQSGPRLKELAVSTSSYGSPIARHFGRMRVAGAIIWSTDLVEHKEKSGGGKGRPKVTTYSYSVSLAVALSSRPIQGVGRIWADGNLLRGSEGDMKTAGDVRIYSGWSDQEPDPLIVAAEGEEQCPAFRGLAYCVFEDLDLSDFGNRIPSLSFEVFADTGILSLATIVDGQIDEASSQVPLPGLAGFSCEGALTDTLSLLDPAYPMDCDASGEVLTFLPERLQSVPVLLPEATISIEDGDFGGKRGLQRKRLPVQAAPPGQLRYYDVDRDYQPGLQRAPGQPASGQPRVVELPAALGSADARSLAEQISRRSAWSRDILSWRTSELDPAVVPGSLVAVSGEPGTWRVKEWEWRSSGVELQLERLPPGEQISPLASDPGRANRPLDAPGGPTALAAFELPWDGSGSGETPYILAAVSSPAAGWSGAALFADHGDGDLISLGPSGRSRAIIGSVRDPLPPACTLIFDRENALVVELIDTTMQLVSATPRQISQGANRALVGNEIIQFGKVEPLGGGQWRLTHLLRGRGGTELSVSGHGSDERFILLDSPLVSLDPALVGNSSATEIVALGRHDEIPVESTIALRGTSLRPLFPVHPRSAILADGSMQLGWTRRARGAYQWVDGVDTPLHEQSEAYVVTFGPVDTPLSTWNVTVPQLIISAGAMADLAAMSPAGEFHVRQLGSYALSEPLFLTSLS